MMKEAMKHTNKMLAAAFLAAALFGGCRREDPAYEKPDGGEVETMAYVSFAGDLLSVQWEGENLNYPANTKATTPSPDTFTVELVNDKTGETVKRFLYGQREEAPVSVPLGTYYVQVSSGEMADVAWEGDAGQPTYGARTEVFDLTAEHDAEHPKMIEDIVCKLQSVKVSVWMEQSMADQCVPAETRIEVTMEDSRSVVFDADAAHRYGVALLGEDMKSVAEEIIPARAAYLKPLAPVNRLDLHIATMYDGQPVDFSQTISTAARAGEWRKVYLYSRTPEDESGRIVIDVIIETFVYDEVVNVEVSSVSSAGSESAIPDIDEAEAPRILAPGFTFHDVTRISASDYDRFGNFVRNAVIDIEGAHPLAQLGVCVESDNRAFSDFLASAGLSGGEVLLADKASSSLVARTTLRGWGFPGREEIEAGGERLSFSIAAFFEFIKDFTGTQVLTLRAADSEGKQSVATMTIAVSADGNAADPVADPRIEWVGYDIRQRHVIEDGMTCKINVYAAKGIAKMIISISGAIGDLILNDLAGALPLTFDLCDTEAYGAGLGASLKGFGFPVDEEVRDQTEVVDKMDISAFLSIMPEGASDFAITVTDKEGKEVTETIMLLKE